MVEVNLRLFVTCRLCLDVQGCFQIDPSVQQQIKYCFDIDVEPFDGLPQLICKKCENILRVHYAIKKNFTNKQKELKAKLQDDAKKLKKSPSLQQDESDNSANVNEVNVDKRYTSRSDDSDNSSLKNDYLEKTTRKKKKVKRKRILNRLMSSSTDDLECNDTSEIQINKEKEDVISWDANFNKYFVCRICSQGFQEKDGITEHIKEHSSLHQKYKNVFKMSCLVVMKRRDKKPNFSSINNAVAYSSDCIIQNKHNPFYFTKYLPKSYSDIPSNFKSFSENNASSSESTDNELLKCKRRRLLSQSSSETVVINRNSGDNNPPTVIDCIDLGDSSDNESCNSNEKSSRPMNNGKLDPKPMHNIIKMCHNKYTKQLDISEKNLQSDKGKEDFLQHKVLSIGRKIINNKGFNCTGLLRFLEYRDLQVVWKETSILNASTDCKYVRIATGVRGNDINDTNNAGWKNFDSFIAGNETSNHVRILKKLKAFGNFKIKTELHIGTKEDKNANSVDAMPRISSIYSHTDLEITKTDSDSQLLHKLLNKNPVSNPKKLPKKISTNDSFSKCIKVFSAPNTVPIVTARNIDNNNEIDNTMPIVTSTVSLAPVYDNVKEAPSHESVTKPNNPQTYPRIKVKPVSELMPDKPTTSIHSENTFTNGIQNPTQVSSIIWPNQNVTFSQPQPPWSNQTNSTVIINNPQIWHGHTDHLSETQVWSNQSKPSNEQNNQLSVTNFAQSSKTSDSSKEYLLLDTVEFPNTKTTSPFQYFQNLLVVHNIILIGADQPLPEGSVCLIKLKLAYQQEKCNPITLCLTLYCLKNTFSIEIKDSNSQNLYINNLSANWQWQLLKIYSNDVISKVLQTAAKVSSETLKYTQEFFALLRSIKSKNVTT